MNGARVRLARLAISVGTLVLAVALPRPHADEMKREHGASTGHDQQSPTHTTATAQPHVHAAVPAEYRGASPSASVWTDRATITRGRAIYEARCATCHGVRGDGRGPAAPSLPVKPPDFRDRGMVDEMTSDYWFWRVSEGAQVEPYKSLGSAMPAWKHDLSVDDRWVVIAYQHSLSGHTGPHVASEHPRMQPAHRRHGGTSHPGTGSHAGAAGPDAHRGD